jgi:TetR/AcrR family transcriptional repressor of lmrAB and yxaGH operons
MMTVIVKFVSSGGRMSTESRDRMIRATIDLLSERGYAGTSFGDVIDRSGAPRGSIYHHFPGGKQQLVTEAVRRYADAILRRLAAATEAGSSVDTVRVFIDVVRSGLRASDFRLGCAIAGVTLDATPADAALLGLAADAFRGWRTTLATAFRRDGATEAQARRLSTLVVASVEGALMLARAEQDVAPISDVGHELESYLRATLLPTGS